MPKFHFQTCGNSEHRTLLLLEASQCSMPFSFRQAPGPQHIAPPSPSQEKAASQTLRFRMGSLELELEELGLLPVASEAVFLFGAYRLLFFLRFCAISLAEAV
jgi:hypothetical protein